MLHMIVIRLHGLETCMLHAKLHSELKPHINSPVGRTEAEQHPCPSLLHA